MANYSRQTQLLLAQEQRKTALEVAEANQILENWPLSLFPSQLLSEFPDEGPMPLNILIAPPAIAYDRLRLPQAAPNSLPQEEQHLLADIRRFFERYYPLQGPSHPTELLEGCWVSGRFHGGASIKALHHFLQPQPFLLLEAAGSEETIELCVAYEGIGQEDYWYRTLEDALPYQELMKQSAKQHALAWKPQREILLAKGATKEQLRAIDRCAEENLAILELENSGIEVDLPYQVDRKDANLATDVLGEILCIIGGWFTDLHHLIHAS
ncbi:MAG TPA: hypothetical protein VFV38_43160 [Ktedonobacteraceae bacterium]|nr:hypothetical protein [Ktedonobacteraceae bacterium]